MVQWLNDNPGLALAIMVAALNLIAEVVRAFSPRAADVIGSLIPHARALLEAMKPAAKRNDSPPPGGTAVLLLLALAGGAAGLSGCGSPLSAAAQVADATALAGEQAAPVLRQHCIDPIPRLPDAAELAALRRVCDPAMLAYDSLRVAHVALRAAIVAAAGGQLDLARLAPLVADVAQAAAGLADSVRMVRGGGQ
jgi:hypothetical protein